MRITNPNGSELGRLLAVVVEPKMHYVSSTTQQEPLPNLTLTAIYYVFDQLGAMTVCRVRTVEQSCCIAITLIYVLCNFLLWDSS